MKTFSFRNASAFVLLLFVTSVAFAGSQYFPDTGSVAVGQRCRDLQSKLSVMSVSLRPGQEDFAALAYLRLHRGAQILSVYVTNGETQESDLADLFPFEIAVARREEATTALSMLESEVLFMNYPDIAAADDSGSVERRWPADSMTVRFMRIISQNKPDLILIADGGESGNRWTMRAVKSCLLAAVRGLSPRNGDKKLMHDLAITPWDVERAAIAVPKGGLKIPSGIVHPVLKRTYESIGKEIDSAYASLAVQHRLENTGREVRYQQFYPTSKTKSNELDAGIPASVPGILGSLDRNVQSVVKKISSKPNAGKAEVRLLLPLLEGINRAVTGAEHASPRERRIVLNWKESIEKLRTALQGITVRAELNYSILTERQLVEFRIDSVVNLPAGGQTFVMFPMAKHGWIVNETAKTEFPLTTKAEFRLVTPEKVDYDLPASRYIQTRATISTPIAIILIHNGIRSEENFIYRITPRIRYAPRFTAEVLTPLVRCIDGEQLVMRLTNHTRDGVSDKLRVADSICYSNTARVALPSKERSEQDTLSLTWYKDLRDTSYLVPVEYGAIKVAQFLGRKFQAKVDTAGAVGVYPGRKTSRIREALRRLGVRSIPLSPDMLHDDGLTGTLRTLIIDRRALSLQPPDSGARLRLKKYVSDGGHLIILAQDASVWNQDPLIDGIRLTPSTDEVETLPVRLDSTSAMLASPNTVTTGDFKGWLIERSYNKVEVANASFECPVRSESGNPLVITTGMGKGTMTYVDLALAPQLMNIHGGAMRILANLISH